MGLFSRIFGAGRKCDDPDSFAELIEKAVNHLRVLTHMHDQVWQLGESDWNVDQEEGTIVFTNKSGIQATAAVQIVGTYNTLDGTWLWGWDNPSLATPVTNNANFLREYGKKNGVPSLKKRKLRCTEERCWEFAAAACLLCDAQGAYRGPAGSTMVFMTFDTPELRAADGVLLESPSLPALPEEFCSDIPEDIAQVVRGFIAALHRWETKAYEKCKEDNSKEAMVSASEDYRATLDEWCSSLVVPQPIAYGSDPRHHPAHEQIVAAAVSEELCRVRTRFKRESRIHESHYEYRLMRESGNWRISSLLVLLDDGEYECL